MLTPEQVADFTQRMRGASGNVFERVKIVRAIEKAAEAAAIERCAKVCDEHLYAEKAAEAIRALLPKEQS